MSVTWAGASLTERFEVLLYLSLAQGLIPIFVGILVARMSAKVTKRNAEITKSKEDIVFLEKAVVELKTQRQEDKEDIRRLQDIHNRRERID